MNTQLPLPRNTIEKTFQEHYRTISTNQNEKNTFFSSIRQESYHFFSQQGIPTRKTERYRYTPLIERLTPLFEQGITYGHGLLQHASLPPLLQSIEGYTLTLCNGSLVAQEAPQENTPFEIYSLAEGYQKYPDEVKAYFNQQAQAAQDPLVALNSALWHTGCFIYLPPQTQLDKPLILHHYINAPTPTTIYPRLLFVMGAHSTATVIETLTTPYPSVPSLVNRVGEIVLQTGTQLTYYPLQVVAPPAYQLRYTYVHQETNSHFAQYLTAATPHQTFVRDETNIQLHGPHAEAHLQGLYSSKKAQHLALHTSVDHKSPHTTTSQQYKGIGQGTSTTLFDGYVHIAPEAQKTVASQQHKGWILSDQASIHARPQLAIEADDVQCSHGTTTTQLDPSIIAYMQARGIPRPQAEKMLLEGFFEKEIDTIPHTEVKKAVRQTFSESLDL